MKLFKKNLKVSDLNYEAENIFDIAKGVDERLQGIVMPPFYRAAADELASHDKSCHTLKNWFTIIRTEFYSLAKEHGRDQLANVFKTHFTMPPQLLEEIKGHAAVRRNQNSVSAVRFELGDYCDHVADFCNSDDIVENYIGVLAMTGRRPVEVTASNFHERVTSDNLDGIIPLNSVYDVHFTGQAKGRGISKDGYNIPLLCDFDDPFPLIERFNDWGSRLLQVTVKSANEALAQFANAVGWPHNVPCTPRTLRAMYACATYALFCPDNVQQWRWVNYVLGHEDYDMVTCQAYMRFKVETD